MFAAMKPKVITKKIAVKNKAFIEAIKSSVSKRDEIHQAIIEEAKKSGHYSRHHLPILLTLTGHLLTG